MQMPILLLWQNKGNGYNGLLIFAQTENSADPHFGCNSG